MLRKSSILLTTLVGSAIMVNSMKEPARKPLFTPASTAGNGGGYSNMVTAGNGLDFFFWGDWGQNLPANESESGVGYEGKKVATQVESHHQGRFWNLHLSRSFDQWRGRRRLSVHDDDNDDFLEREMTSERDVNTRNKSDERCEEFITSKNQGGKISESAANMGNKESRC